MAVPRVFVSSTYYDLKQVRYNVGDFIKSLGYEPVMHERSGVAYTQSEPLEQDCYHELAGCDIVVCIIGNHFGSQSSGNELSITMNEIKTAIKEKKKVYIFISRDVYIENRTYELNKDTGSFKSAYTDNNKIHEFISELKNSVKVHVIESFETTDEITHTLKLQFAGLFQNLLARDASYSDSRISYDLQKSSEQIQNTIALFQNESEEFFKKFDSTVFRRNNILNRIGAILGLDQASVFARNIEALDELMTAFGFASESVENEFEDIRRYVKDVLGGDKYELILKENLFETDGTFKDIRSKSQLDNGIIWNVYERDEDQLPF